MNNLKIFENNEFGKIRTVTIEDEPWFVGKDIATALGYQNGSRDVNRHVDDEDRTKLMVFDGNQNKETIVINESGVYSLILGSKLESAKRFKHWVTSEVLPSIRKTGKYQVPLTTEGQIKLLAKGHTELVEKIESVNNDLQEFKKDLPLLGVECERITRAVKAKGIEVLGGKRSEAYRDNSLRNKVYSDIYRELKRQFDVKSYKELKRCQCEQALEIIQNYTVPIMLAEQIKDANAQMRF